LFVKRRKSKHPVAILKDKPELKQEWKIREVKLVSEGDEGNLQPLPEGVHRPQGKPRFVTLAGKGPQGGKST